MRKLKTMTHHFTYSAGQVLEKKETLSNICPKETHKNMKYNVQK